MSQNPYESPRFDSKTDTVTRWVDSAHAPLWARILRPFGAIAALSFAHFILFFVALYITSFLLGPLRTQSLLLGICHRLGVTITMVLAQPLAWPAMQPPVMRLAPIVFNSIIWGIVLYMTIRLNTRFRQRQGRSSSLQ